MTPVPPVIALPRQRHTPHPGSPLPLPSLVWGAAQAAAAVRHSGLADPEGFELLGNLSAVVFAGADLVVKVHPPASDVCYLTRIAAAMSDCPVVLAPLAGPVWTPSGIVTTFRRLVPAELPDWADIGGLLRRLHDHHAPGLPAWVPLRRLPQQVAALPATDRRLLLAARDRLLALAVPGTPGTLHGDVSPDNCAVDAGQLRLIDLDVVAAGPREYDLAAVLRRRRAGVLNAEQYTAFCAAYGADVEGWAGLPVVDEMCALSALGFVLWAERRQGRPVGLSEADRLRWESAVRA